MASNVTVDQITTTTGAKTVTVLELHNKLRETSPVFTSLTSNTGKIVTVDSIYGKVNEDTSLFKIRTANFVAAKGMSYRFAAANLVATLPAGSTLVAGDSFRFAKLKALTPSIVVTGSDTITINGKVGDSILFDDNVEFVVVWNGTGYEV